MRLRSTIPFLCLLPLAGSFACGAADESASLANETEANADLGNVADEETDVVASTVYFHERQNADGTVLTGISEQVPANYASTPLQALLAQGPTDLEVFLAVLPNEAPPESFVASHPAQTAELGRETDAIRGAVFDANAPIEKSVTWCKGIATPATDGIYNYTYSGALSSDDVYGSKSRTLNAGTKETASAICNETKAGKLASHKVKGRVLMKKNVGGSYDNPGWTPSIAPGGAWYWLRLRLWEYNCPNPLPPGQLCLPNAVNASYQIQGKSDTASVNNTYDLYIAKIETMTLVRPIP
jgi:hypothetical protein